jgi:hypothetical protein
MKTIFSVFEAAVSTGKRLFLPSRQVSVESRRFSEGRINLLRPGYEFLHHGESLQRSAGDDIAGLQ